MLGCQRQTSGFTTGYLRYLIQFSHISLLYLPAVSLPVYTHEHVWLISLSHMTHFHIDLRLQLSWFNIGWRYRKFSPPSGSKDAKNSSSLPWILAMLSGKWRELTTNVVDTVLSKKYVTNVITKPNITAILLKFFRTRIVVNNKIELYRVTNTILFQ